MFWLFLLLLVFFSPTSAFYWTQPNLGRPWTSNETGSEPGIKYYLDQNTFEALPFFYKGCGGDGNRYDNRSRVPQIADYSYCPGYPVSVGGCNTGVYFGSQPKECPTTAFYRQYYPFEEFGQCCDSGAAKRVEANREAPHCKAAGFPVIVERIYDRETTLFGRNCTHNVCPLGSERHQGEFYGYCCWKPSSSLRSSKATTYAQPNAGRLCQPGEKGSATGIRYYADHTTNQVFPFLYYGCGRDNNPYKTQDQALMFEDQPCPQLY